MKNSFSSNLNNVLKKTLKEYRSSHYNKDIHIIHTDPFIIYACKGTQRPEDSPIQGSFHKIKTNSLYFTLLFLQFSCLVQCILLNVHVTILIFQILDRLTLFLSFYFKLIDGILYFETVFCPEIFPKNPYNDITRYLRGRTL